MYLWKFFSDLKNTDLQPAVESSAGNKKECKMQFINITIDRRCRRANGDRITNKLWIGSPPSEHRFRRRCFLLYLPYIQTTPPEPYSEGAIFFTGYFSNSALISASSSEDMQACSELFSFLLLNTLVFIPLWRLQIISLYTSFLVTSLNAKHDLYYHD